MRLRFKEEPREWRKSVMLGALGPAVLLGLLAWRHRFPVKAWAVIMCVLAAIVLCACWRPRWFRGYYRFATRSGFYLTRSVGLIVLAVLFVVVVTPLGLLVRAFGKDPLRLKRPAATESFWQPAKKSTALDSMF